VDPGRTQSGSRVPRDQRRAAHDRAAIKGYQVDGTGDQRTIVADVEWTFPLSFAEVVWGDGKKVDRQVIPATDLPPFGSKHFAVPFDANGRSWVRFAVWDSAGNGAFVQPVWLKAPVTPTTAAR
jgi:hypothetical protein